MRYLSIVLTSLLIAFVHIGCRDRTPVLTEMEGTPLPSFTVLLRDSSTYFNTSNLLKGKPVVLIYISPSCPYCRIQLEDLVADINSFKDVQFCVFTAYPIAELRKFCESFGLDKFENILPGYDYSFFVRRKYKTKGVPFTIFFDSKWKLTTAFEGMITSATIRKAINGRQ